MIRRWTNKTNERRSGAALVEAALVLPIFFTVVLGVIEFGRFLMVSQLVQNAAREACRKSVTGSYTNATVTSDAQTQLLAAGIKSADVTMTITVTVEPGNPAVTNNEASTASAKDIVAVVVSVPFNKVALVPGTFLGAKTITGRSTMRHE